MDSSKDKSKWEFVGEAIIIFLWLLVIALGEFDFWMLVVKAIGGAA